MFIFEFVVPTKPVPKARPRFARNRAGGVCVFSDRATASHENLVAIYCRRAMSSRGMHLFPIDCATHVDLSFFLRRPLRPKADHPIGDPDLDNLIKCALDGIVKAGAIADDSRIVQISACKAWAARPESRIRLIALQGA